MRPTRTTGSIAPYASTADICRSTFSRSRIAGAETSRNDSTQSPAWSRNARPSQTSPSDARSARASPANTSGGSVPSRSRTAASAASSGHSGRWAAGSSRHEDGVHVDSVVAIGPPSVDASRRLARSGASSGGGAARRTRGRRPRAARRTSRRGRGAAAGTRWTPTSRPAARRRAAATRPCSAPGAAAREPLAGHVLERPRDDLLRIRVDADVLGNRVDRGLVAGELVDAIDPVVVEPVVEDRLAARRCRTGSAGRGERRDEHRNDGEGADERGLVAGHALVESRTSKQAMRVGCVMIP